MDNLRDFDISRVWIIIRKNQKLQKTCFLLAIVIIQGISDIFYSIQELSGIFMEFSSRDIKKWYRIRIKGKG
jgi:hypothetical protein